MRLTRYLRTALLTKMGDNAVAAEVLNRLGEGNGVTVSSRAGTLRLLKAPRVILLHPKHFAYAIDVAKNFDLYFDALDCQEQEGLRVVSYSEKPELLVLMRYCLERGLTFWIRDGRLLLRKGQRAMRIAVDRQIYAWAWEMAGHFERHFLPVIPTDEQGIMTVDYSKPGILQTYARSGLQFELASFPEEGRRLRWILSLVHAEIGGSRLRCGRALRSEHL